MSGVWIQADRTSCADHGLELSELWGIHETGPGKDNQCQSLERGLEKDKRVVKRRIQSELENDRSYSLGCCLLYANNGAIE